MMKVQCYMILAVLICLQIPSEAQETVSKIDMIPLWNFKYYQMERMRWGELNAISGYKASDKLFKYKSVDTALGKVEVPVQDRTKLKELSMTELASVFDTRAPFDGETQVAVALELVDEGEYQDAIAMLKDLQRHIKTEYGKDHVLYANCLADLGTAYYKSGDYATAMEYFRDAAAIDEKLQEQYGPNNYAASSNMLVLAAIKSNLMDVVALSSLLENAFEVLSKDKHEERYRLLINLANLYIDHWMPLRAIAILKKTRQALPKDSPLIPDVQMSIATAYFIRRDYKKTVRLLIIAKDLYEKMGSDVVKSDKYIECLFQLANANNAIGNHADALAQLKIVKESFTKLHPNNNFGMALIVTTMGQAYLGMNNTSKALMFFEAAESLSSKESSADTGLLDLRIVYNLGKTQRDAGNTAGARPHYQRFIEMGSILLGKDNALVQEHKHLVESLK